MPGWTGYRAPINQQMCYLHRRRGGQCFRPSPRMLSMPFPSPQFVAASHHPQSDPPPSRITAPCSQQKHVAGHSLEPQILRVTLMRTGIRCSTWPPRLCRCLSRLITRPKSPLCKCLRRQQGFQFVCFQRDLIGLRRHNKAASTLSIRGWRADDDCARGGGGRG